MPASTQGMAPTTTTNTSHLNNMDNSEKASNGFSQRSTREMEIRRRPTAISVKNANKSYSSGVPVLKNFNMTVPQGTIYGLLGASGCGKTTMLSCIVGIRHLDSGDIFVFGQKPGTPESGIPGRRVGYMPQDIALYTSMSIQEQLQYFGRIYGMSHSEIMGRIEFLTNFLDLPPASQRIGTLSGGQQRRTSLAACLLHEPSLLILDEPTVGVDPLLRENIWEYLCDLVAKKHTTVIITTHYIEEARQSNTVGLMRNGRLLVEKAPDDLLREHNTSLLEDIVLKLCKNDTASFGENGDDEVAKTLEETSFYTRKRNKLMPQKMKAEKYRKNETSVVGLTFKQSETDENQNTQVGVLPQSPKVFARQESFRDQARRGAWAKFSRVRAVTIRNSLNLLRNPIFMLAIFFMPSFQVIMVNLTVGPEPKNMKFGVVNPEVNFEVGRCSNVSKGCKLEYLSCKYINALPSSVIIPVSKNSVEDALSDVRQGKLWGYMSFPKNYTQHMADRVLAGNFAENISITESTIEFRMDSSHYFAGVLLTKTFYETFQTFAKEMLGECDSNSNEGRVNLPLNFRKPIYGTFDVTFQQYISPGVLIIIIFFIPYLSCAVANITDRKQGTLDRSMVAGATTTDIMIAFFVTEGALIVVQTMISLGVVIFVFQWEIQGSIMAYICITILTGVAGLSFGFLIAQLCTEEMEALIVGIGCYLPNLILSGIIWPLEATSPLLRAIAYCLPCTWSINAIRSIISRGWPVTHKYVWPGYGVLMVWITLTWILAIKLWRSRS